MRSRFHCWLSCCISADRSFADFIGNTATLPYLECIGPAYVAAVIAAFRALILTEAPGVAAPGEVDRMRVAAIAVLPLTEMLAARGLIDDAPILDWMLAGGATQAGPETLCECEMTAR